MNADPPKNVYEAKQQIENLLYQLDVDYGSMPLEIQVFNKQITHVSGTTPNESIKFTDYASLIEYIVKIFKEIKASKATGYITHTYSFSKGEPTRLIRQMSRTLQVPPK